MEAPRQPSDLRALLRFALQGTAAEDPTTETVTQMDEERRRWLEEALKGLSVNVIEELVKALEILNPERVQNAEEDPQEMEEALDGIIDFVDSIDTANDFQKIGGLCILSSCLNSPHEGVRWRCGELIATLTQNNPHCQVQVLKESILPLLLEMMEEDASDQVRIKSLYALSCLVRECPEAQEAFNQSDGFSKLLRILQSPVEKLKIKAAFLLTSLCNENPDYKDTLCDMGFVEQFVALLQHDRDTTHEHLLSGLLALVSDHQRALAECRRPEFMLRELLESRIESLRGQEECQEELEYCRDLLTVIFSGEPVEDR